MRIVDDGNMGEFLSDEEEPCQACAENEKIINKIKLLFCEIYGYKYFDDNNIDQNVEFVNFYEVYSLFIASKSNTMDTMKNLLMEIEDEKNNKMETLGIIDNFFSKKE
jgi:uncharacterized protein with ParB-like and HNH nuclease domain